MGTPPERWCPNTFVCGRQGTGKTSWIRRHVIDRAPRLFVFDHMAEFAGTAGATTVHTLGDAIAQLRNANRWGLARIILTPARADADLFRLACRVPLALHGLVFVVDEIDTYAGAVVPPAPESFRQLMHFGRHFGCAVVAATRRPADCARLFTSQAPRKVCFAQDEPADLRWLRSVVGPRADELPALPDLQYLAFENRQVTVGTVQP